MHPTTIATLSAMEKAAWFSRVGLSEGVPVVVLSSWQQAIARCESVEWENFCLEAANQLRAQLTKAQCASWNDIVVDLKKATIPLVRSKIQPVAREHKLPKVFEDTVQWDILHVCMETEYGAPGFYASLAAWYVKGHFPCGWAGDFPEGRLIVY